MKSDIDRYLDQDVEEKTFMARVFEQSRDYEQMFVTIKDLAVCKKRDFTSEELNLIAVACKNYVSNER